jgi:WD40 repeat protein
MLDLERTLPVLQSSTSQIPLALSPHGNTLLYAHQSGVVPLPTDRSVPDDMAALNYANSLLMATLDEKSGALGNTHELLLAPPELANIADYHWVLSPQFSPDGQTLTYTVFSSDTRSPFRRYHSLYTVQLGSAGATLHADKPQLLATSTSSFVELGPWLDNHILTFYADGALHALDIRSGASTTLAQLNTYARIVAVIG